MSSDNEQRIRQALDVIIENQAQFSSDMVKLEQQTKESREDIAKLTDVMLSLANVVQRHDDQIAVLIEQGQETDRRLRETDERLNVLIRVIDKFISGQK